MQDYKELYRGNGITLYGAYEDSDAYVFRVELDSYLPSGLNYGFSGAALFSFVHNEEEKNCQQLRQMYDSLNGECLIQDYEFGNELKLFFDGRQLKIEGKFDEGDQLLKFSGNVDQTIIPRIISLFQKK